MLFFFKSQGLFANTSQAAIKQHAVITPDAGKFDMIIKLQIYNVGHNSKINIFTLNLGGI